jgi:formylglycine-generating enzyme required for sulfatase activity
LKLEDDDLAVIEAEAPAGLAWRRAALGSPDLLERGTQVWFVGIAREWDVPTISGRVNRISHDLRITFDSVSVLPGTSGAPLISGSGIVGMIIEDSLGGRAIAVSVDVLRRAFLNWPLPWLLASAGTSPEMPTELKGKDGAEMVLVPAGEFWMGSDDGAANERPRRKVYLDAFYVDKYEVTNGLYKRFLDESGGDSLEYWTDSTWNAPPQPVVGVSWDDARAYCAKWSKRLPTEAEWEKAMRGIDRGVVAGPRAGPGAVRWTLTRSCRSRGTTHRRTAPGPGATCRARRNGKRQRAERTAGSIRGEEPGIHRRRTGT